MQPNTSHCTFLKSFLIIRSLIIPPTGAAAFLASLYIGDMWLGAESPVMFNTYVKMVCEGASMDGSKETTPRKKKEDLEAMVSLCSDLSALLPKS